MRLVFDAPEWNELIGGSTELEWMADRQRKFELALSLVERLMQTTERLRARDELFHCTPETLTTIPLAADWYISLAGYALNTLGNITESPATFGLSRNAKGLVESLELYHKLPAHLQAGKGGRRLPKEYDLKAFSDWINSEIRALHPIQDVERAYGVALMILGGRVIGQGQNASGQATVDVVKSLIVQGLSARWPVTGYRDGKWLPGLSDVEISLCNRLKFDDRLTVAFPQGGGAPDMVISVEGQIIAVAEIKGRKDTSNLFESWMPTINEHLRTWRIAHPDASKLFFGTVITKELVSGKSKLDAQRVGLKELYDQGLLHALYNVSKIVDQETTAVRIFGRLLEQLDAVLRS